MSMIGACEHKPSPVFSLNGVVYHGASASGVRHFNGNLVVNFTGSRNLPYGDLATSMIKYFDLGFANELMVPWPDFGLPAVKDTFWVALHSKILNNNWESVCFHCAMGHGRTGTALCAMLIKVANYSGRDAVMLVRDEYCKNAVETRAQMNYLADLAGDSTEMPRPSISCPSVGSFIGGPLDDF